MRIRVNVRITLILAFLIINASPLMADETVDVVIHGLEGDALANVETALAVPEGMVKEGKVNEFWVEYFRDSTDDAIRKAMQPFGYYDPLIEVLLEKVDDKYIVTARIIPGEPVRVTEANISVKGPGAEEKSLSDLALEFPLRKGDILLHRKYEDGKGLLKAHAHDLGYLDADFSVSRVFVSKEDRSARIELSLETGPLYRFGRTRFEGAPEYPEKFKRRYISFREGDVFSHSKLGETQLNLLNSERFSEAIIAPQKDEAEELRVPLVIRLKSSPARRFRTGLGYGTDTGARLSAAYRDLNVFRNGNEFNSSISVSERLQGAGVGYTIPGSKDIDTVTSSQLNFQHEDVDTYETELISLELSRTRSFKKGRQGTVYLKMQHEESTIAPDPVTSFLLIPGFRFSHLRYDDLIRPTKGFHYILEVQGTTTYFGSDMNLVRFLTEGNVLFPLPWQLSLLARVKTGISLQDDPLRDLPASLRFFAGGDRSIRGYEYQSLGPEDSSGEVTGGKHLLTTSIEIERPLSGKWGVALFYDSGNAFNSFSDINFFHGAGLGLRYYTVVGVLRLDVARQIGVDDPKFRIHFTAGVQL